MFRDPAARPALAALLVLSALFSPGLARAQLTSDQAVAAAGRTRSNLPPDTFGGDISFGKLSEDFILTLALHINFDQENWGVGLQAPLRLRLIDRDPKQDDWGGVLRREDWDEVSDFLRVIRYVYVGQRDKKGPFYIRVGELAGLTVGHGTIMYRYYNGTDVNVWHTGLNTAVNIGAFGGEVVVGDVVDPYVAGLRFSVRPLELALGDGFLWNKLVIGASIIADTRAPYELSTRTSSVTGMTTVDLDKHQHPVVTRERTLAIIGADVGIELLSNDLLSITPYVDFNKMTQVDKGWGLHMGVLWGLHFPVIIDTLTLDARTEYRRVSGDYVGPYFNTTYEIERYQVLDGPSGASGLLTPKLRSLADGTAPSRNGVFFDLLAGLPSFIFVGGEYIDYDGGQDDGTLRLSLEVPALSFLRLSAFYYRINIKGLDDLFELDNRSALVAQASIPLYAIFSANLRWSRVWEASASNAGQFEAVDDWSVGFGFNLQL